MRDLGSNTCYLIPLERSCDLGWSEAFCGTRSDLLDVNYVAYSCIETSRRHLASIQESRNRVAAVYVSFPVVGGLISCHGFLQFPASQATQENYLESLGSS